MKKVLFLLTLCMPLTVISYGQKLSEKEGTKILERAWTDVKKSDTADFIKLWLIDDVQWPYHAGQKFTANDVRINFRDFKSYFDSAIVKNMKFAGVTCDTVEHNDPHHEFAQYYIKAWFKYSNTHTRGFGFYMTCVNKEWYIRFSPDYSDVTTKK